MTRALLGSVAASGLLWLAAGTAIDGAKPPSEVPVTASFANNMGDGLIGIGVYANGVNNVASLILGSGNYILDTNDRATIDGNSRLGIDFRNLPGAPYPPGVHAQDVFVGTIALEGATPGSLATMAAGGPDLQRKTRVGWTDGGEYSLRFDNLGGDGVWNFHCETGTPCTQWTVTPTGPATLYTITVSSKGRPPVETLVGQFSMPFTMTLTR